MNIISHLHITYNLVYGFKLRISPCNPRQNGRSLFYRLMQFEGTSITRSSTGVLVLVVVVLSSSRDYLHCRQEQTVLYTKAF